MEEYQWGGQLIKGNVQTVKTQIQRRSGLREDGGCTDHNRGLVNISDRSLSGVCLADFTMDCGKIFVKYAALSGNTRNESGLYMGFDAANQNSYLRSSTPQSTKAMTT